MERPWLLRCVCCAAKTAQLSVAASAIFFLAGCSTIPPEYNPVDWAQSASREVSSWFGESSEATPSAEPPAAEGRPFPNLGTVPRPPFVSAEDRAKRENLVASMQADRDAAIKADTDLREQGTFPRSEPQQEPQGAVAPSTPAVAALPSATAPVIAPSSAPAALAPVRPAAVPAAVERVGSVTFAGGLPSLSGPSRSTLLAAASVALKDAGRVRVVPAEFGHEAVFPQIAQQRQQMMTQVLVSAGLPADRVSFGSDLGQRVDVYDVYVDQ